MRRSEALEAVRLVGKLGLMFVILYRFWSAWDKNDWKTVGLLGGVIFLLAIFEAAEIVARAIREAGQRR